ncbi:DMT family transporter [Actinokineospora auranticolor]|uniref:Transporter family-2 protein n=1 Tax=Actinokineospora auranticolor TaxID=155976 RepID=A0A2S6GWP4_9PSEU|nr:DMT family transporter [Actinokineospora auranticolor]PPK69662.1 transporter family-2 protein [Actinokineospora auranticolor]
MRLLAVAASLLAGLALAVQSKVNGALGHAFGDGLFAALTSFGVGLVLLVVIVVATPSWRSAAPRFTAALRSGEIRPWQCLGGAAGACYVTSQGLTVTLLGVAMFTVAGVAGQVVSSLLVDRAGFGPGDPRPVTPTRALGALLTVVAVGIAVSDELSTPDHLWLSLVPALAGAGIGWAQAANGLVGAATRSVGFAALVNFAVGTVFLVIACLVDVLATGLPAAPPSDPRLYLGGTLGVVLLLTTVFAVRQIGALLVGLCAVAAQVAGAVLLDVLASGGIEVTTLVGTVVTLLAAGLAAVPSGRARVAVRG